MEDELIDPEDLEDGEYPHGAVKADMENLNRVVGSYGKVVIDLWAPWCGPCKALSPVINQMADELHGEVVFAKMNAEENRKVMEEYMVQSIPTMLVFKDGVFKDRIVGAMDKSTLIRKIVDL